MKENSQPTNMSQREFGLSPRIQALLDSETPDWSTVTLDNVHDAFKQLKGLMSRNRRRNMAVADAERAKTMGRYIFTLLRIKAAKWAERGEEALCDAITRTRSSLHKSESMGLYTEIFLNFLLAEASKLEEQKSQ